MPDTSPADRLRASVLAAIEQYETETTPGDAAEDDDPLSRSYLRWTARQYEKTKARGDLDQMLNTLATDLTLTDLRILRTAAEAAASATPRIVMAHFAADMPPAQIATETGLTQSRIYGIIRQARADGWTDPVAEASETYRKVRDRIATVRPGHEEAAEAYLAGTRAGVRRLEKDSES